MTGLMKKDFYLSKKFILIGAGLFILGLFFAYLIRFSFLYGNLQYMPAEEKAEELPMLNIVFTILPALLLLVLWMQSCIYPIYMDIQCKWYLCCFSAPVDSKLLIRTKYAELFLAWSGGLFLALASALVYGFFFGFHYTKLGFYGYITAALFVLLCSMCMIPLSYRYKTVNAVVSRMVLCLLLPLYLGGGFLFIHLSELLGSNLPTVAKKWLLCHRFSLSITGLSILGAIFFVSYKLSLKFVERRDMICGD